MIHHLPTVGPVLSLLVAALSTAYLVLARVRPVAAHHVGRGAVTVGDIRRRLAAEGAPTRALRVDSWLAAWSHGSPESDLTVAQAHDVMRMHRDCGMEACARKRVAYWTLVAQGRIRPDDRAERQARR